MSALVPDDIAEIWRSINSKLVFQKSQHSAIAYAVGAYVATARIVGEQQEKRKRLEAAFDLVAEWCAEHRREVGKILADNPDAQPMYNPQIVSLEKALQAIPRGYIAPVSRSWTIAAQIIWQAACKALVSMGKPAGSSAKSLAVRFTSALLNRVGYQNVTPDAVRKEIDKFKEGMSAREGVRTPTR